MARTSPALAALLRSADDTRRRGSEGAPRLAQPEHATPGKSRHEWKDGRRLSREASRGCPISLTRHAVDIGAVVDEAVAEPGGDGMFFFFNVPAATEIYTLSLHDALPI